LLNSTHHFVGGAAPRQADFVSSLFTSTVLQCDCTTRYLTAPLPLLLLDSTRLNSTAANTNPAILHTCTAAGIRRMQCTTGTTQAMHSTTGQAVSRPWSGNPALQPKAQPMPLNQTGHSCAACRRMYAQGLGAAGAKSHARAVATLTPSMTALMDLGAARFGMMRMMMNTSYRRV
jgi:hypothetical protein